MKPVFPPAGAGQTRPPQAENPGSGRATVIEVLGTWLHRPGKDKLGIASLNPHPINQVPTVKPIKDSGQITWRPLSRLSALTPAGEVAFSSVTGQEDKLTLASV